MAPWTKLLERLMDKFNPFAHPFRLSVDTLVSETGEKRILLDGIDFTGAQTGHFDGKESEASASFDANGAVKGTTVFAEEPLIGKRTSLVVVDGNEGEKVVNGAKPIGGQAVQDVHTREDHPGLTPTIRRNAREVRRYDYFVVITNTPFHSSGGGLSWYRDAR